MSVAIRNTLCMLAGATAMSCAPDSSELIEEAYARLEMRFPRGVELHHAEVATLTNGHKGVCGFANGIGISGDRGDVIFVFDADEGLLLEAAPSIRGERAQLIDELCREVFQADE